ncbi:GbsR/MarR family transcriptional regulator [Paenibacillus physcomitrellae]|uniref:HTH-type transcriptional regulator n=1 Tax=Paenibacillus physcomitrellae TaxID=1619311 RepID=A0ABQ1FS66_9BACL|nr:GbsR/MarR family transcriptional regulator [Paenibacillus physcomitrellae]GGA27850.1 HTH-type transcriptional repressor GbsR [Paenibacillus physcomitrellae]
MGLEQLTPEEQAEVARIRKRVIETIGSNMDLYGITQSTGHLYGLMFFSDKPMTLDEMGQEMKMSKTSMSTGVRKLLDLKMVNKVWEKGSRKDLYEVEYDWHQTFADFFATEWRRAVESNRNALRRSLAEINRLLLQSQPEDEADAFRQILLQDKNKMENAMAYYAWLDRLIDAMESGEIFDWIPKELS